MYTTEILMLNDAATDNVFWFYKGFFGAEWSSKKKHAKMLYLNR